MKKLSAYLLIALPFFFLFWLIFNNTFFYASEVYENSYFAYRGMIVIFLIAGIVYLCFRDLTIAINHVDIIYTGYILIAILSNGVSVLSHPGEGVCSLFYLYLFYILCRICLKGDIAHDAFATIFAILFVIELFFAVNQYLDFGTISQSSSLAIRGSMGNSGIYSCFCIIFIIGVIGLINNNSKLPRGNKIIFFLLSIVVFAVIIIFTRSRGALIAFVLPLILIFILRKNNTGEKFQKLKTGLISGTFILASLFVFFFKVNSALGRVLIWRVASSHILQNWFLGIGFGEFPHHYSFWQANYFAANHHHFLNDEMVSDFSTYAFNEPLQILIETGIIGFSLFFLLNFFVLFKTKAQNSYTNSYKLIICVLLVFSSFSYPFHSFPLFAIYTIIITLLSKNLVPVICISKQNTALRASIPAVFLVVAFFSLKNTYNSTQAMISWNQISGLNTTMHAQKLVKYHNAYPYLSFNSLFLFQYGMELSGGHEIKKAIQILEEGKSNMADVQNIIYLGRAYEIDGNFKKAEKNYRLAELIMPFKLEPKFCLLTLYKKQGQNEKALSYATTLLNMKIKVPSPEVDLILDSVKNMTYQNK